MSATPGSRPAGARRPVPIRFDRCCRRASHVLVVLSIPILAATVAEGRHLKSLSELLVPAYTAMSNANSCSMDPGWAVSQPHGRLGVAINYAEHIKDEIIASLSRDDAVSILKAAADAARSEARRQLKDQVVVADKDIEAARFGQWCRDHAGRQIRSVMRSHDGDHVSFLGKIDAAKSNIAAPGNEH